MVQRVYGQIQAAMPEAKVTIATSKSQVSSIVNQLGFGGGNFRGAMSAGYLSCYYVGGNLSG